MTSRVKVAFAAVLLLAAAAAVWLSSAPKLGGVAGLLNYWQLWTFVGTASAGTALAVVSGLPKHLIRPYLFRLLASGCGLLFCLVAVEVFCWLLPSRHVMDNPWYAMDREGVRPSDRLPWTRPPNLYWEGTSRGDIARISGDPDPGARHVVFQTDYQGFRNSKGLPQAQVVFIGDSFTEAGNTPEDETFVHRVGQNLGVSVRNLGRSGYSSPAELIVLREYGLACQPRVVVWQICEANDLDEALAFQQWVAKGRPREHFLHAEDPNWTRTRLWQQRSPTHQIFALLRERNWDFVGRFTDEHRTVQQVYFLRKFGIGQSPAEHEGWPIFHESLRAAAELLKQAKIPWIVLYIPMKFRVLVGLVGFDEATQRELLAAGFPRSSLEDYVHRFCRENDVPLCSVTVPLQRAASQGKLVYLPLDTHLSPAGHEVVSEVLSPMVHQLLQTPAAED